MNIDIIGTGDVFSERLSPCVVINKEIVFDMPNGSIKELHKQNILLKDINIVLISHFHADHCFDIPFFILEKNLCNNKNNKTIFVGPAGLRNHIDNLLEVAYSTIDWQAIKKKINYEVIEIEKDYQDIEIYGYDIKCLKMEHSTTEICFGYIIKHEEKSVGFTGDSKLCKNIKYLVRNSLICFADMSSEESSNTHMGIKDIEYLNNINKGKCIVYPVHTSNKVLKSYIDKGYKIVKQGDNIII